MIMHNIIFIVISAIFAVIEGSNLSSYSSRGKRLFKFIFSISLGLFLSFISLVAYEMAFNEYSEIYKLIIIYPCIYISFIGFQMMIYGIIGAKEYSRI